MGKMLSPIVKATIQSAILSSISNILAQLIQAHRSHVCPPVPLVTLVDCVLKGLSGAKFDFDQYTAILTRSDQTAYTFAPLELLRFVLLTFITAPPNYRWQQFLERSFPAYNDEHHKSSDTHTTLPMTMQDTEKKRDVGVETTIGENGDSVAHGEEASTRKLNWKNTLIKWFIDCITLGALVNTVIFFVLMGVMKGQAWAQIERNVRMETIPLIVTGYKVWPLASIISFSLIPVEKRIVFLSLVGLLWGIYVSLIASRI